MENEEFDTDESFDEESRHENHYEESEEYSDWQDYISMHCWYGTVCKVRSNEQILGQKGRRLFLCLPELR